MLLEMNSNKDIKKYWEQSTPMSFVRENLSYEEKRNFRYSLQDYMCGVFRFNDFAGKSVLEIGCGAGIDSAEFARNGASVTSADLTWRGAKLTYDLLTQNNLTAKVIQCDARALPFKNESFDCAYSFGVLHHFPDMEMALAEIYRVLKPGGQVMVMLYHRDSILYAYSIIYWRGIKEGKLGTLTPEQLLSLYSERNEGCPYTRAYSKEEAIGLFSKWFSNIITEVHYNVLDLPDQRKVKIDVPPEYALGWHLVLKAEKVTRSTKRKD
jgi:ubiquinone/menaquinone biosynthesis C-methylase UbiE